MTPSPSRFSPGRPVQPEPPAELASLAPGWEPTLAYSLIPEITTWRLRGPGGEVRFAKVDAAGRYPTLRGEAERMVWAAPYLPVPRVIACEQTEDGATILLTEALPGRDATDPIWHDDLPGLVRALGRGLRTFHESVGEEWCPFRFEVARALEHVARRIGTDDVDPAGFHEEHAGLTPAAARRRLEDTAPDTEELVVCHGDYCAPNVLLEGGIVTGYVDLGELNVADRWWDVAVGAWSAGWNFGEELELVFYEGYGIEPDPPRIRFYRLLYDLVS
ncbi:MAG TPA: aminoglycoside 3'-phosphotransferase [Acidimicrobiales bacterium]|nr:aminoglycoside 3'-phosphotransferase [Acidimicrobiales bacterium]